MPTKKQRFAQPNRRIVSTREAAIYCGISRSTVSRRLANPASNFPRPLVQGGVHLYWLHELDAYLESLPRYQPPKGSGS